MNVIVWGINYSPELTGIAPFNVALCEYLVQSGCTVEMVTAFPYYPQWSKRSCDRGKVYDNELQNGVRVNRCWLYVPSRVSALRRIAHEGTFVVSSFIRVLFLKKPSVFVVVSPPLMLGVAAWVASIFKRAPFVFHVQDLQPDAAVGLGMLRKGWLTKVLYWTESFVYLKAAKVSGISRGMLEMFRIKDVPEEKLLFFPNGVRLPPSAPLSGLFRAREGVGRDAFVAVYSGNLGVKQDLDILVDVAKKLAEKIEGGGISWRRLRPIIIVIAGDGARRASLAESIKKASLKNIRLLPLQSHDEYREMLVDADCILITQQAGSGSFFFPSKLLTALAFKRPILGVSDDNSELAKAIAAGGFGINVPPGQPELLSSVLLKWAACASNES